MTAGLVISVCVNLVLLAATGAALWRQRQFRKPFDPKVSVYAQNGDRHGWVTTFEFGRFVGIPLSHRPIDASLAPLSEIRNFVNTLVKKRYYVKVVRVVHPEHWRDGHAARKTGGACDA